MQGSVHEYGTPFNLRSNAGAPQLSGQPPGIENVMGACRLPHILWGPRRKTLRRRPLRLQSPFRIRRSLVYARRFRRTPVLYQRAQ